MANCNRRTDRPATDNCLSVHPHQKHSAFFRVRLGSDFLRLAFVVAQRTNAHPLAGWPGELSDVRVGITLLQLVFELAGFVFALKGADLHAPASPFVDRS